MAIVKIEKNRYTVDSLYQWDINQKLEIRGLSLPSIPEIHFSNTDMGRAIVRQSSVDEAGIITVDIPNSLLQKPYRINAYICIYEDDTFKSLYCIEIPVKARTKPSDYTIEDDEEIYSFKALENLIYDTANTLTLASEELVREVDAKHAELTTITQASKETSDEALAIAKGKVTAQVFDTFRDMESWLSNANNMGQLQVGDNLFIKDVKVLDYWISAVLNEADVHTGYYYNIAPLESQSSAPNIFYNGKIDANNVGDALDKAQGAIDEVSRTLGYTVSKNYLPNTGATLTNENVTHTRNSDRSVTSVGTCNNGETVYSKYTVCTNLTLKKGKYILSGCPSGGSGTSYKLDITGSNGKPVYIDYGEGCEINLEEDTTFNEVRIIVYGGTTINATFYPMISVEGGEYEPYVEDVLTRLTNKKGYNITFNSNYVGGVALSAIVKKNGWAICKFQFKITSNVKADTTYAIGTLPNELLPFGSNNVFPLLDGGTSRSSDVYGEIHLNQNTNDITLIVRGTPNTGRWYHGTFSYPLLND